MLPIVDVPRERPGQILCWRVRVADPAMKSPTLATQPPESCSIQIKVVAAMQPISTLLALSSSVASS